jgi:hypothetical protein
VPELEKLDVSVLRSKAASAAAAALAAAAMTTSSTSSSLSPQSPPFIQYSPSSNRNYNNHNLKEEAALPTSSSPSPKPTNAANTTITTSSTTAATANDTNDSLALQLGALAFANTNQPTLSNPAIFTTVAATASGTATVTKPLLASRKARRTDGRESGGAVQVDLRSLIVDEDHDDNGHDAVIDEGKKEDIIRELVADDVFWSNHSVYAFRPKTSILPQLLLSFALSALVILFWWNTYTLWNIEAIEIWNYASLHVEHTLGRVEEEDVLDILWYKDMHTRVLKGVTLVLYLFALIEQCRAVLFPGQRTPLLIVVYKRRNPCVFALRTPHTLRSPLSVTAGLELDPIHILSHYRNKFPNGPVGGYTHDGSTGELPHNIVAHLRVNPMPISPPVSLEPSPESSVTPFFPANTATKSDSAGANDSSINDNGPERVKADGNDRGDVNGGPVDQAATPAPPPPADGLETDLSLDLENGYLDFILTDSETSPQQIAVPPQHQSQPAPSPTPFTAAAPPSPLLDNDSEYIDFLLSPSPAPSPRCGGGSKSGSEGLVPNTNTASISDEEGMTAVTRRPPDTPANEQQPQPQQQNTRGRRQPQVPQQHAHRSRQRARFYSLAQDANAEVMSNGTNLAQQLRQSAQRKDGNCNRKNKKLKAALRNPDQPQVEVDLRVLELRFIQSSSVKDSFPSYSGVIIPVDHDEMSTAAAFQRTSFDDDYGHQQQHHQQQRGSSYGVYDDYAHSTGNYDLGENDGDGDGDPEEAEVSELIVDSDTEAMEVAEEGPSSFSMSSGTNRSRGGRYHQHRHAKPKSQRGGGGSSGRKWRGGSSKLIDTRGRGSKGNVVCRGGVVNTIRHFVASLFFTPRSTWWCVERGNSTSTGSPIKMLEIHSDWAAAERATDTALACLLEDLRQTREKTRQPDFLEVSPYELFNNDYGAPTFRPVDKGAEGAVYRVCWGHDVVAVKATRAVSLDDDVIDALSKEANLLRRFPFDNVIRLRGVSRSADRATLYVVMDWMNLKSLFRLLSNGTATTATATNTTAATEASPSAATASTSVGTLETPSASTSVSASASSVRQTQHPQPHPQLAQSQQSRRAEKLQAAEPFLMDLLRAVRSSFFIAVINASN